jgi:hypothetical protein
MRVDLIRQAEEASFLATFSTFAATVAEQRYDTERAESYRVQAAQCRLAANRLRVAAERCRPWWRRPRAAFREACQDLYATCSWRPDDPGPARRRASGVPR